MVEIALLEKIENGTVNGDPLKRYAPEEKLRYGTVRVTNSDALLYLHIHLKT